jgi:hypothetical protein
MLENAQIFQNFKGLFVFNSSKKSIVENHTSERNKGREMREREREREEDCMELVTLRGTCKGIYYNLIGSLFSIISKNDNTYVLKVQ